MRVPLRSLMAMTALAGIALFAASGCKRGIEGAVDSRIDSALPHYLGPADRYSTHIDAASPGAILRGRLRSVQIDGDNVHLRPGLVIDHLTIVVQAVEVDTHRHTLESVGTATLTGSISGDNLTHYLDSRKLKIKDLGVSISDDRLVVRGRPEVLGFVPVPVKVRGMIELTPEGDHLDFVPDRASITIIPVPGPVLTYLSHKVNPIVDLTKLPLPIHVQSVTIANGLLTMTGTIDSEAILQAAK